MTGSSKTSASFFCDSCKVYVDFKNYDQHSKEHIKIEPIEEPDFSKMSHKEVLRYYVNRPQEIERGMAILWREFWAYRGRIDLIGRDINRNICIIEVVHKSKYQRKHWKEKLRKYKRYMHELFIILLERRERPKIRMLIVRPVTPIDREDAATEGIKSCLVEEVES